ncbi:hypothetical protein Hanom_Chr03g00187071 [Helianthus anomalus]
MQAPPSFGASDPKIMRYRISSVKNIAFTGVFRLIFKPLVPEFPCFGAVSFSLRHKKQMDFTLKVVGGDISAIPGVADALESLYRAIVCFIAM